MSGSTARPHLRIVRSHDDNSQARGATKVNSTVRQPMLFSDASSFTLGFIKAGELDADSLASLIEEARPRIIFDLRPAPSFARGTLARRAIFSLFEKYGAQYFDVAGVLGISARRDGLLNPALLVDAIQINILRSSKGLVGPIFFFVDDELFSDDYFSAVATRLLHQDSRGWDIACWPNDPQPDKNNARELIFVSHANPEDNDVARWLSTRLAAQGYRVWSDVTRLIGGELLWDTIEQAIRNRAAKVIVLLSKRGHQKSGLLDEVNVAVATERVEGLDRFVIPVRIDDLPYTEVRANLARKNIIDGSDNLAAAFRNILKALNDDGVPRARESEVPLDLTAELQLQTSDEVVSQWEFLFENKVEVLRWPSKIRKFRTGAPSREFPFVNQSVRGGNVTFETWDKISEFFGGQVQKAGESIFSVEDWSGSNEIVFYDRAEMRRALASITRQAWDRYCHGLGMSSFPLANGYQCWFFRNGFQTGNRVRFKDRAGVERSKFLVGHSPRRNVFWHFAVEARPNISDNAIRLVPHVLFSEDGVTPIQQVERQHSLRRGFCKSWWNARWRDLLIGMLNHLARGAEAIQLPVSESESIAISARLTTYDSTVEDMVHRLMPGTSKSQLLHFEEPRVAVGYGQTSDYPKEGLLLFGPVAFGRNPTSIRVGVVGTREGVELFQKWSAQFNSFQKGASDVRNSIPFPGFEPVFGAKWVTEPVRTIVLSRADVINSILLQDRHQAIYRASGLYVDAITQATKNDDLNVDIWYVIIPDEVYAYGRPTSRVPRAIAIATPNAMGRHAAKKFSSTAPSLFPEDNAEALIYDHYLDFHHQLKARLLKAQAVTQVLRESSLATVTSPAVDYPMVSPQLDLDDEVGPVGPKDIKYPDEYQGDSEYMIESNVGPLEGADVERDTISDGEFEQTNYPAATRRQMQDAASFSWNIGTTTFFKAGGRPWRVATARDGVCYIGLIFKRDSTLSAREACCGAQMFLNDSEGIVFKGAMGPWYSPDTGHFHLDRAEATRLVMKVLSVYEEQNRVPAREIFIHGRTRFNEQEWLGFRDAVDLSTTKLTAVRITRSNEYKLYSGGELAVKRGTALRLGTTVGLLWTSGYVDRLGTYPGRETPNPLRIEIVRDSSGSADIQTVMRDIMMLTKMNFNSCVYADGIPVTMRFADAIGDVLVTAKDEDVPPLPFRYYI